MNSNIVSQLESLLFYKAEPLAISQIATLLSLPKDVIEDASAALAEQLTGRGVRLLRHEDQLSLVTAPENAGILAKIAEREMASPLSKAALETLSIIIYRGPITASAIDHIRGVSSHYVLRSLMMRGLIERTEGKDRAYKYTPSFHLLSNLGITDIRQMPEYEAVQAEFAAKLEQNPLVPEPDETQDIE